MEHTPFDASAPNQFIGANLPPSRPQRKNHKVLLWASLLVIAIVAVTGATIYTQNLKETREREEKLAALRQDIKKLVLEDNALVLEMLDQGALEHITYAEFFKRAEKNKEERDSLIRKLRSTETGPYGEHAGNFIKLMETENEWVRAEEAVSHASLDVSGKWDIYKEATDQTTKAAGKVSEAKSDYYAAPYGEDYDEAAALNYARAQLNSATESTVEALDAWKKAANEWKEKKKSAAVVISDWMRTEPLYYPNFAPQRKILDLLLTKKTEYIGREPANKGEAQKAETPSVREINISALPTASPQPSSPTRVRSLKPLDGERFPETRTNKLGADYAYNLNDEDLRYAINEMYARYGMTFKDKTYQANFEGKTWYRPDDRWTPAQIQRGMNSTERANLDILVGERDARRSGGVEG